MKFTIKLRAPEIVGGAQVEAQAGQVLFNGVRLLSFEAAMLADALNDCAEQAEKLARAERTAQQPETIEG